MNLVKRQSMHKTNDTKKIFFPDNSKSTSDIKTYLSASQIDNTNLQNNGENW